MYAKGVFCYMNIILIKERLTNEIGSTVTLVCDDNSFSIYTYMHGRLRYLPDTNMYQVGDEYTSNHITFKLDAVDLVINTTIYISFKENNNGC